MDKVMNVRVPEEIFNLVKAEASREERTYHYVIRKALTHYFANTSIDSKEGGNEPRKGIQR